MIYCYNCGTKNQETDKFCSECGAQLSEEEVAQKREDESAKSGEDDDEKFGHQYEKYGIIFTNIKALCDKLNASQSDIVRLFEQYIKAQKEADVKYNLIDVSNYCFKTRNSGKRNKTVSLSARNAWWDYQEILLDYHQYETEKEIPCSSYLFIVGGNDIIPVPVINHYLKEDYSDKNIETDLLYAYPYGAQSQALLENTELFKYEMIFLVGRLPLPSNCNSGHLFGYLQRAAQASQTGIEVNTVYGQCDPHWKFVSSNVIQNLTDGGLFPEYTNEIAAQYYYNKLFLSPEIDINNIEQVFDTEAELFYFNLHGSNAPSQSMFFGQSVIDEDDWCQAISPKQIETIQNNNIIVTEACYGGKFVGYDIEHSMLHTALFSNTLTYVGSSRTAFGATDCNITSQEQARVSLADILCGNFINAYLSGYSAGEAMFFARKSFFRPNMPISPHEAITISEFNLFGDPTLHAFTSNDDFYDDKALSSKDYSALASKDAPLGFEISQVTGEKSILEQVRNLVNINISQISESINHYLYEQLNIPPRAPKLIFQVKYKNKQEELCFNYEIQKGDKRTDIVVTTHKDGKIASVNVSK